MTLAESVALVGPTCRSCDRNEARCARVAGCCDRCTHTFGADSEGERIVGCTDCGGEFAANRIGRSPKHCADCVRKRATARQRRRRERHLEVVA